MCTASWIDRPGGYELLFNRDERRTRLPADPPAAHDAGGTSYLAPLDGDAGGTWIAVNSRGLSLALLNGFPVDEAPPEPEPASGWTSRGHVIPRLMRERSALDALDSLAGFALDRFRPMQLLALDATGIVGLGDWSGRELDVRLGPRAPVPPLISSSFCTTAVRASRLGVWRTIVGPEPAADAATSLRFHRSHAPRRGPHSVCMHRPDARTVSFTRVVVERGAVTLEYTPDAPCRGVPDRPLRLARVTTDGAPAGSPSES